MIVAAAAAIVIMAGVLFAAISQAGGAAEPQRAGPEREQRAATNDGAKGDRRGPSQVAPACLDGRARPGRIERRPAVAVKVENAPAARPQSGLEHADVVFEEIVEGGITRFMAIFHCGEAGEVGPVRSARLDDARIAKSFTRLLAYSGSNKPVMRELAASGMRRIDEGRGGPAFYRLPPGSSDVYSLFASTEILRRRFTSGLPAPAGEVLRRADLFRRAKVARRVSLTFSAANPIEYRYADGLWARSEGGAPFVTASGGPIAVPNLLIQRVRVDRSETVVDVAGNPSPELDLDGGGPALLFRSRAGPGTGGRVVKGSWRFDKKGLLRYARRGGEPLPFAGGPVWVELLPFKREGDVRGTLAYRPAPGGSRRSTEGR